MPRTKRATTKPSVKVKDSEQTLEIQAIKKKLEENLESQLNQIDEKMNAELEAFNFYKTKLVTAFPTGLLDRTVREIMAGEVSSQTTISMSTLSDHDNTHAHNNTRAASSTRVQNSTMKTGSRNNSSTRVPTSTLRTNSSTRSSTRKRSLSATYDASSEGSQVSNVSTATGRKSRARTVNKNTSAKPISRSLSRTAQKAPHYKTPAGKTPNSDAGTITPKCKPNTPQLLMRRPKQGEVAISYQGSPLLTGNCMREDVANINIPLPNGDLLSLLPESGLRPSLIPSVDEDTRRQLEILRDNLIRVCSNMK